MRVVLYQGRSWVSRAIKFITRSKYSHAAFMFDEGAVAAAKRLAGMGVDLSSIPNVGLGAVIEAWDNVGVRSCSSISDGHAAGTPVDVFEFATTLSPEQEERLLLTLIPEMGCPYDWKSVFRFITRKPGKNDRYWFCSEIVDYVCAKIGRALFLNVEPWEVQPGWVAMTLALIKKFTTIT